MNKFELDKLNMIDDNFITHSFIEQNKNIIKKCKFHEYEVLVELDECNNSLFKMEVCNMPYNVVLTPCCSIQTKDNEGNLIITPLIKLKAKFYSIPLIKDDLLMINRLITSKEKQQLIPVPQWNNMSEEAQAATLNEQPKYELIEYFIFDKNDLFENYSLDHKSGKIEDIRYYMIDFRNTFNIKVENIKSPNNIILKSKIAELTKSSRISLNEKLKAFYRIAEEDLL